MRSPSTVGVPRGPGPRSLSPARPIGFTQTSLPSARLSADTTLCELRIPWTKMRSRLTAIDPKPAPRFDALQVRGGPAAGQDLSSPVSGEMAERDGPRHCGQSVPVWLPAWPCGAAAQASSRTHATTRRVAISGLASSSGDGPSFGRGLGVVLALLEQIGLRTDLADREQRAAALDGLAAVALEDDLLAGHQISRPPSLSPDPVRAGELQVPVHDLAVRPCHVDVDAHVRVGPRDLRDDPFQLDLLFRVVLGIEPVVRDDGSG